jgi:hypothetical protein
MPFYEMIFEDGSYSIAFYETDEEGVAAAEEHHNRAKRGERALLSADDSNVRAVRVVRLLKYDRHPDDLLAEQTLPADEVKAQLNDLVKSVTEGDVVHVPALAAAVRNLTNPLVESGPHESNYKAQEAGEVELPFAKED